MKSFSLRNVTLLSVLIVTLLFILFAFLLNFLGIISVETRSIFVLSGMIFLSSSILFYFILRRLVFKRIDDVRNTIRKYRETNASKEDAFNETPLTGDDILDLGSEVLAWSADRKNEIDKLHKLELYRKEFLGNVSHELKTPVFNIQGYIATLLDGGIDDKAINREYLMRAEKSVDRMISMISDLEAITQLETGQLELEYEKFDIIALVKDVFETEEIKAGSKGIMLRFKESNETPVYVYADKFRIRQVITNLIVNSINYGKEFGETLVRFYMNENNVVIEITDNGPGIAKEHLPRLFERFYRVDKGRSRAHGGTGLGLAIVKHIIEAHGQTISVNSKEGSGTTVSFTLKSAV